MSSRGTKKKVAVIVQARIGSTRLPGKVLMNLTGKESVLGYLLKRLSKCRCVDKVIVATTTNPKDDVLEKWLKEQNYLFFRGSEEDCIERYCGALEIFRADIVVRITSDCPLVVPQVIDEMIEYYLDNFKEIDYLSNRQFANFPDGVDTEIFTFKMLEEAKKNATLKNEREHINNYFLNRPSQYRIRYYNHNMGCDYSRFKLSIDTATELEQVRSLFSKKQLPLDFSFEDLMKVITDKE